MEARGRASLAALPAGLRTLPRVEVPLLPFGLVGVEALRQMGPHDNAITSPFPISPCSLPSAARTTTFRSDGLDALVAEIAQHGKGFVMTMGKGGVGKTTVAARIAIELTRRGFPVTLTTTDPAAHVEQAAQDLRGAGAFGLRIARIDPAFETRRLRNTRRAS